MATPALRLIRESVPGALIGALLRPGMDELLTGSDLVDQIHVDRARGVMGPKLVASRLRQHRYDTCLLLTNSFSTALIARLAFIRRRIGYDRDGRGLLLTDRLEAPRRARPQRGFAPVPAVEYYLRAAHVLIGNEKAGGDHRDGGPHCTLQTTRLELPVTPEQAAAGETILQEAGLAGGRPYVILNPGANNEAKRWPAQGFATVGAVLASEFGMGVLVNGSPGERDLARRIAEDVRARLAEPGGPDSMSQARRNPPPPVAVLPDLGITIGALKEVARRAALMVTNDTGPRHIAAAFGVPRVVLFGPTDPRWTTLPAEPPLGGPTDPVKREIGLTAAPDLPPAEVADDHPDRCRIDQIPVETVLDAARRLARAALTAGEGRQG